MNKYQEALDRVCNPTKKIFGRNKYGVEFTAYEFMKDNFDLLQELVDKATPKKPIEKTYEYESMNEEIIIKTYHVCGCEKYSEVHHIDRFCPKCGQAIDWSKDDNTHR